MLSQIQLKIQLAAKNIVRCKTDVNHSNPSFLNKIFGVSGFPGKFVNKNLFETQVPGISINQYMYVP